MSANNPPGGQDPDRTVAYRWNQGQPDNPPTTPLPQDGQPYQQQQPYPQQPYPPQQPPAAPYQQQPYGAAGAYGQQPQQGNPYGQQQAYGQQPYQAQPGGGGGWNQQGPADFTIQEPPAKKSGKGWLIAAIAAFLVVVVGGGGVYAVSALSGGGTQPQDVLPGNAIGYVRLDLDPAANQKLAMFSLAGKFTVTKDKVTGDDPRQALFGAIQTDSDQLSKVDFAKDVDPWLGSRIGVAALPPAAGAEEPGFAVAVQVKDETQAKAGIAKLMGKEKHGVAFREDYAIISDTAANAAKYATGPTLAENTQFTEDFQALGEPGLLSFWAPLGKLAEFAKAGMSPTEAKQLDQVKNARFAGALRFDSAYVELAGIVRGMEVQAPTDAQVTPLAQLPASTAGALSISGMGEMVTKQWSKLLETATATPGGASFQQFIDQAQQSYGLALPGDLATLLGENLTVALDGEGLDGDTPNVGVRIVTDPAKAGEVVGKLEKAIADSGQPTPQLAKVPGDGTYTIATTPEYAKKLAEEGALGDSETFKTAIPNADAATVAIFVDLDKIEPLYIKSLEGDNLANAKALRAIGISSTQSGGDGDFSVRVLVN